MKRAARATTVKTDDLALVAIEDIGRIDGGGMGSHVADALSRLTRDIIRRPILGKPRSIRIDVTATPVISNDGELDHVLLAGAVTVKLPGASVGNVRARLVSGKLRLDESVTFVAGDSAGDEAPDHESDS